MHDDHRIIDERMEKYGSFLIRLHLKVPLPRRIEESSSRREGRVEKFSSNFAKILILQNTKFKNFTKNFVKLQKRKILQPPYVGVEWGGGAVHASHVAYYFSDASPQSFFALFSRVIDVSRHASSCFKYAIKNWTRHKFQRSASTPPPGGHPLYPFIFQPNRRSILAVNLTPPCPVFRDWSTVFQCFVTES